MKPNRARYLSAMIVCFIVLTGIGCATTSQKVNTALLEQSKNKTFRLGIVKAAGSTVNNLWSSANVQKAKALEKIPTEEICSILSDKYAITVDCAVDKTPKTVQEAESGGGGGGANGPAKPGLSFSLRVYPSIENVYFGNLEYKNASSLAILFGGSPNIINGTEIPDVVNIIYSLDCQPFPFKTSFLYEITVESSGEKVVMLRGKVGQIETPTKYLFIDHDSVWTSYIDHAGSIGEALKRDLEETEEAEGTKIDSHSLTTPEAIATGQNQPASAPL